MSVMIARPWESLPNELALVRNAIEQSRAMLHLPDDWDGEGGQPICEGTWQRAIGLLMRQATSVWQARGQVIDVPDITPVPDGGVDIHWDRPGYELLINIPAAEQAVASFYGDDRGTISIKGELDPRRSNEALTLWLTSE